MKVPADVLEGFPSAIQQHPYLRIRLQQFVAGHSKESAIEACLVVVANQSLMRAGEAPRSAKPSYGLVASAIALACGLPGDFSFLRQTPEVGVRGRDAMNRIPVLRSIAKRSRSSEPGAAHA